MITKGYHTLEDRDNVDEIETGGPKRCVRKDAWLGDGYYFWDGDIEWAHQWGKSYYLGKYLIFQGEIAINEETYDLYGNTNQKMEFKALVQELIKNGTFNNIRNVKVPEVIEYLKKYIGFDYNSIRAADITNKALEISFGGKYKEFMYVNERVQVCLITKKNLTSRSFKVVYPLEYVQ